MRKFAQAEPPAPVHIGAEECMAALFDPALSISLPAAKDLVKICREPPLILQQHKSELIELIAQTPHMELKWQLALMLPRLELNDDEAGIVWDRLMTWACDKKESRILRTNSVQGLFELLPKIPELQTDFDLAVRDIYRENIPSINARIHLLKILPRPKKEF